jgi:hypothetical protein
LLDVSRLANRREVVQIGEVCENEEGS